MRNIPYITRFQIESSKLENGQLLVSGKGLAGEAVEDALLMQPHGAASRPPAGSTGFAMVMPGRRTQMIVMGVEHPDHRPDIGEGDGALYDGHGNSIKLAVGGVIFDFGARTITLTGGEWQFTGNVTITGNLNVSGNIESGGAMTSGAPDGADE